MAIASLELGVTKREWFELQSLSPEEEREVPLEVTVAVLQATGMQLAGSAGTLDAYATVELGEQKWTTSVQRQTLSPTWDELFKLELGVMQVQASEAEESYRKSLWRGAQQGSGVHEEAAQERGGRVVRVQVWHQDMNRGQDHFLGQVQVPLAGLRPGDKHEAWFDLGPRPADDPAKVVVSGAVHVRFVIREKKTRLAVRPLPFLSP
jgi:hypothetical protein